MLHSTMLPDCRSFFAVGPVEFIHAIRYHASRVSTLTSIFIMSVATLEGVEWERVQYTNHELCRTLLIELKGLNGRVWFR
jgi:hypothetical protein